MLNVETPTLTRRVLQICCSIAWCLVAAGPVFGFAALKPVLIMEGIYREKCNVRERVISGVLEGGFGFGPLSDSLGGGSGGAAAVAAAAAATTEFGGMELTEPCKNQDLALNFMFTLAAVITNVAALPVGSILDEYGPRVSGILGSILLFLASLSFKYGDNITSAVSFYDPYLSGYTLLALGGPFVFISCYQLANSFPKNSGLILALLTGAFDSSLALFMLYRVIYTRGFKVHLDQFFTYYMIVPVFILVCQVFIMPRDSYKTVGTLAKIKKTAIDETGKPLNRDLLLPEHRNTDEDVTDFQPQPTIAETTTQLIRRASTTGRRGSTNLRYSCASRLSVKSVYEQHAEDKLVEKSGGVFGIMHGYDVYDQLTSSWFILMTLFTTLQMLRINYFVATIRSQEMYLYNGDEEVASAINRFFDLALPVGGLISIPFIGIMIDNMTTLTVLTTLTCASLFFGVMGLLSWTPATYAGIICLVIFRPFYYTSVSDFCAKVFGFDTFGTIYGAVICIAGIGNLLQHVLDTATHLYFHMNPLPANIFLTACTALFGGALILFVHSQEHSLKRKNLEMEAQDAVVQNLPN